jgi:hypothetical protein
MKSNRSLGEQIELVERKLDVRRQRTTRHWQETKSAVSRKTAWAPLFLVAAALLAGAALAHRSPRSSGTATHSNTGPSRSAGLLATFAAAAATAIRLATSPMGRTLWSAWRARTASR